MKLKKLTVALMGFPGSTSGKKKKKKKNLQIQET